MIDWMQRQKDKAIEKEADNEERKKIIDEQIKNLESTLLSDENMPAEARLKIVQKLEMLKDSIADTNGKVCLLTFACDDDNFK